MSKLWLVQSGSLGALYLSLSPHYRSNLWQSAARHWLSTYAPVRHFGMSFRTAVGCGTLPPVVLAPAAER